MRRGTPCIGRAGSILRRNAAMRHRSETALEKIKREVEISEAPQRAVSGVLACGLINRPRAHGSRASRTKAVTVKRHRARERMDHTLRCPLARARRHRSSRTEFAILRAASSRRRAQPSARTHWKSSASSWRRGLRTANKRMSRATSMAKPRPSRRQNGADTTCRYRAAG
jgi:hypothetical protein